MSSPPPVIALAELAQMLGVSRHRAMQILAKPDFPHPIATLSNGRIWSYEQVADFCEATGRRIHPVQPGNDETEP